MSLKRNFSLGLINSLWGALSSLLVVPYYLKYLGTEAYGLVAFYVTLNSILQIFDFGLASTINREIATAINSDLRNKAKTLLKTIEVIYWVISFLIFIFLYYGTSFIVKYWIHANSISIPVLTDVLHLTSFIIVFRWPVSIYIGALMGAQKLDLVSFISIFITTMSTIGAVLILIFYSTSLIVFFEWQLFLTILNTFIFRYFSWNKLQGYESTKFDLSALIGVWKYSLGMLLLTISAVIFTQLDKVILSKLLTLSEFGIYMVAFNVSNSLSLITTPAYNVMYPRFSFLVASGELLKLKELYFLISRFLATILFALATVLVIFSKDLIYIWTDNASLAEACSPLVRFLAIGSAIHGIMHMPHALQLAKGMVKIPLQINLILIILMVPIIIFLVNLQGAQGAAISWLILHILYMIFGTYMTHQFILKGLAFNWIFHEIFVPFGVALFIGSIVFFVLPNQNFSINMKLFVATTAGLLITIISVGLSDILRKIIINFLLRKS